MSPRLLVSLSFCLLICPALSQSQILPDSLLSLPWYKGIVNMQEVFFLPEDDLENGYFFVADKAVPEVVEVTMKEKGRKGEGENGRFAMDDGRRAMDDGRYKKIKIKFENDGKKARVKFTGVIARDTVDGWLRSSWLTARRLGIPGDLGVYLVKEKPVPVPQMPERYREELFRGVNVRKDVYYGMAEAYYTSMPVEGEDYDYQQIILDALDRMFGNPAGKVILSIFKQDPTLLADLSAQSLYMDIYEPAGDLQYRRPLVLLLHGGAFIMGDKRAPLVSQVAEDLAKKGYVVASIDYRLGLNPGSKSSLERSAYRAVQDARAALRYLSHFQVIYRINPDYCFVGGSSAGAITALNTAFMKEEEKPRSIYGNVFRMQKDLGGLDESTNDFSGEWQVKAVANLWGAVIDTNIIDPWEKIPVISFHGDADDIVPFGYNYPFPTMDTAITGFIVSKMFGSRYIDERLNHLQIPSAIKVFHGMGHEPQCEPLMNEVVMESITKGVTDFFADAFFGFAEISAPEQIRNYDAPTWLEVPYIEGVEYFWKIRGGKIITRNSKGNRVEVVWPGAPDGAAEVMMVHPLGAGKTAGKVIQFD